jgi:hypothetical protein
LPAVAHAELGRIAAGVAFFLLVALLLWRRWRRR